MRCSPISVNPARTASVRATPLVRRDRPVGEDGREDVDDLGPVGVIGLEAPYVRQSRGTAEVMRDRPSGQPAIAVPGEDLAPG